MPDGKRLWRTEDDELVEDGHEDAVELAYGIDDDLSPEDAERVSAQKAAKPAPNKSRQPHGNKAG